MGLVAGYYSGRLYKTMKGKEWKVGKRKCASSLEKLSQTSTFLVQGCCFPHGNPLPWDCLWHWLLCEPVHLGEALQRSDPLHHYARRCCHVVWHLVASCLPRILLRIQVAQCTARFTEFYYILYRKQPYEHPVRTNQIPRQVPTQVWFSSTNALLWSSLKPNFLLNLAGVVHAPCCLHPDGWHPPLWCLLHRALLHLLGHLREPVLLLVRLPLPRLHHPRHLLLTDIYRHGLFPALWGGLQMVVEVCVQFK